MNGIALHGGMIPYGGTFLAFADYNRPAIRLAALMGVRVIHVMTHDLDRPWRGRPDASAGRTFRGVARHSECLCISTRGRGRDGGGLGLRAAGSRSALDPLSIAPGVASPGARGE